MNICEYCGADAVDARGVCRNCGRRASRGSLGDSGIPSLGETRAADVPATLVANPPRRATGVSYCGACGAPIEPGHAFCGQCGTPVRPSNGGASPLATDAAPISGPSGGNRYRAGSSQAWQPNDWQGNDAPTEQFTDLGLGGGYGRSGVRGQGGLAYQSGVPYGRSSYPGQQTSAPTNADNSSRTLRLVLGLLCLAGGFITGVAAIVLAIVAH